MEQYRDLVVSDGGGAEGGSGDFKANSGGYHQLGWGTLLYTLEASLEYVGLKSHESVKRGINSLGNYHLLARDIAVDKKAGTKYSRNWLKEFKVPE
jgi:hypothetical protein